MKGAATKTATRSGFVVLLLYLTVVKGQDGWGVTYPSTQICTVKGSTVVIHCTYTFPPSWNEQNTKVIKTLWFTKVNQNQPVDLITDPLYTGRVEYHFQKNNCTLRITDMRESDVAEYKFMFITNQPEGRVTGSPGVTLSVTALQVQVNIVRVDRSNTFAELKCHSSCSPAVHPSYIWFKNGENIQTETSSFRRYFYSEDSFACALKGYENFPSSSVCVHGQSCNRVMYDVKSICSLEGSSVDISSTYFSYWYSETKIWFSPDRSHQWQNHTQPEDISKDSQYAGRVQVIETWRRRSTLRISDLREKDSAQYHFKFKTWSFEWKSSLPGTTLTVTALKVQVTMATFQQDHTEAELRCHHSCSPAGRISYVWFKNGEKILNEEKSSYKDLFYPGNNISCAVRGLESYRSASLYALKAPSVSTSPSGEIMEGTSVTLNCNSDADGAVKFSWYKRNRTLSSKEAELIFGSVLSSDSGEYCCTAENELGKRTSEGIFINVKYGPRLPTVSVSPSAEIVEGSSVTMACSSDANPAANYTWYRENEESPEASGPTFTITYIRAEQSGNYYCEAHNGIGRHNSILIVIDVTGAWTSTVVVTTMVVVLAIILLSVFILIKKKRASKQQCEERPDDNREQCLPTQGQQEEQDDLHYSSVKFTKNQAESLYSNIRPAQRHRHNEEELYEGVEYSAITFNKGPSAPN